MDIPDDTDPRTGMVTPALFFAYAPTAIALAVNSQSARPLDNCKPKTAHLLVTLPANDKGYN